MLVVHPRLISIDSLGPRRLLSVTINNGLLTITGTGKNDIISLFLEKKNARMLDVKVNKTVKAFATSSFSGIFIEGFAGDDQISISEAFGAIANNVTVYGDGGNDSITTASGTTHIFLGSGND